MSEQEEISKEIKSCGVSNVTIEFEEQPPFWYRWAYLRGKLDPEEDTQKVLKMTSKPFLQRKYVCVEEVFDDETFSSIWTQDPNYG